MGISQRLCEVRDREFGGKQKAMWRAWDINPSTLNRWLNADRIPDPISYDFLAAKLGLSIGDIHELCQIDRRQRGAHGTAKPVPA